MGDPEKHANKKLLLQHIDEPCPSCGYRLKNLASDRCPECGCVLIPTLRAPIKFDIWYLFLIGVAVSVGVSIFLLGIIIYAAVWNSGGLRVFRWKAAVPSLLALLLLFGILVIWWNRRDWFSTRKRYEQIEFGILGMLLPFIVFAVLFTLFLNHV